jgi:hypothetical protein
MLRCTARHGVACVIERLNSPVGVSALFFACRISRVRGLLPVPNIPHGVGRNVPVLNCELTPTWANLATKDSSHTKAR